MRRFSIHLALVALSLLSTGILCAEERPLKGGGSGGISTFSFGTPYLSAVCEVTHHGRSILYVNVDQDEWDESQDFILRKLILIAANGDRLEADLAVDFNYATGVYGGRITLTGGTGRFENATGAADLLILYDWPLNRFNFYMDGTIDF